MKLDGIQVEVVIYETGHADVQLDRYPKEQGWTKEAKRILLHLEGRKFYIQQLYRRIPDATSTDSQS